MDCVSRVIARLQYLVALIIHSIISYDIKNKKAIGTGQHDNFVPGVCISPDSKYIVTGSTDKTIKIWLSNEMKEIDKIK